MQNICTATACIPEWTQLLYAAKTFSLLPRSNPCLHSTWMHAHIYQSFSYSR